MWRWQAVGLLPWVVFGAYYLLTGDFTASLFFALFASWVHSLIIYGELEDERKISREWHKRLAESTRTPSDRE